MREKKKRTARSSPSKPARKTTVHGVHLEGAICPPGGMNWAKIDATTDEDIAAQIASDPDAVPDLDDTWFAAAARHMPREQKLIGIRVDEDVIAWFKSFGRNYQPRMNAVLRGYMEMHGKRKEG